MGLTGAISHGLRIMSSELAPTLDAQREFGQTNEGLGSNSKESRKTCAKKVRGLTWGTVYSPARPK